MNIWEQNIYYNKVYIITHLTHCVKHFCVWCNYGHKANTYTFLNERKTLLWLHIQLWHKHLFWMPYYVEHQTVNSGQELRDFFIHQNYIHLCGSLEKLHLHENVYCNDYLQFNE